MYATSILICALMLVAFKPTFGKLQVGVGRSDCTGPAAGIAFMGYAKASQVGCGIHLRQFSRAFVFKDDNNIAAFVSIDACMMNNPLKQAVIDRLDENIPGVFTMENTVLSGTHSHSGPGGFLQDIMLDIPNMGYVDETFEALVVGITESIKIAHTNLMDAQIFYNSARVEDANTNRSPAAYELNPEDKRQNYKDPVDKDLVQLKIVSTKTKTTIGAINWFAVHPTSMNNTNCLVSSDNVGYASILLEKAMNPESLPGEGSFVGAFASSNLGDVSPNLNEPICLNTGEKCDYTHSSCPVGANKYCVASGPGKDIFESTEIIANRIFNVGKELLEASNSVDVTGTINFIHRFTYMPNRTITYTFENGTESEVSGCLPAMGYGFAAGTTDGPGEFNFEQATNTSNPFWNAIRDFLAPPTPEDKACHAPKPILIMSGRINYPYEWQPLVVAHQIIQIGEIFILAVPGEFTTMAGRDLRESISAAIADNGGPENAKVIIAGLSNVYTNYIATPEEYQLQRYEGASTIYGPYTLPLHIDVFTLLTSALLKNEKVEDDDIPYTFPKDMWTLVGPNGFDSSGWDSNFGDVIVQPKSTYKTGDTVSVKFVAGHPRNDNLQGKTFLTVERLEDDDNWNVIANDACWETRFIWRKSGGALDYTSSAEILWEIPETVTSGTYRIQHFGNYKYFLGGIYPYSGTSKSFTVTN